MWFLLCIYITVYSSIVMLVARFDYGWLVVYLWNFSSITTKKYTGMNLCSTLLSYFLYVQYGYAMDVLSVLCQCRHALLT